jgi:twitching motility two-component system response regulator PilH
MVKIRSELTDSFIVSYRSQFCINVFFTQYKERVGVGIFDKLRSIFGNSDLELGMDVETGEAVKGERRRKKRLNARGDTRALIIDDSPTVIFALKKILRSAGWVTFEALDAEAGINLALAEKPDLIFLDIVLPGVNGFAALRTLRRDPLTQNIPVIMISGNEQATELFFGSRIGADDFMKKPFSRFEVFARIERLLDSEMVPRRIAVSSDDADLDGSAA